MSLIAEFTLSNPILRQTREALPEVIIEIEDEHISSDGDPELVIFVTGDDADLRAFEERLPTDTSIETHQSFANFNGSILFQITLSEEGFRGMTYPIAVNLDITFLKIKARGRRMQYRAQVPTRDALSAFCEQCSDRELSFQLTNLYHPQSRDEKEYGLTSRQREVLRLALQEGYFAVPRQTTLADLAAEFEISDQAVSSLLRRGQVQLLRHTIGDDADGF